MRIVIDTNLWVSGLLWRGLPWRLLRLAEAGYVTLCITPSMITELAEVLAYPKLQSRLNTLKLTPGDLIAYVLGVVTVVDLSSDLTAPIVLADPDDDVFLHCAQAAHVMCVVSGDHHLLDMKTYADIPILTVQEFFSANFPLD